MKFYSLILAFILISQLDCKDKTIVFFHSKYCHFSNNLMKTFKNQKISSFISNNFDLVMEDGQIGDVLFNKNNIRSTPTLIFLNINQQLLISILSPHSLQK